MEGDWDAERDRAVEIASRVLAGLENPILGARELTRLRFAVGVPDDDADFMSFVAIDSETDALPVGDVRQYWAAESLAELAPRIASAEAWAMKCGREAFENVVRRFGRRA